MAMRVATFGISEQMIAAALRTQSVMAEQQIQEASGQVSSDFAGYGSSTQQILNLQVSVSRSQSYIDAATQAGSKIEVMYSTVNSVADLLTELRTLLTGASNTVSTDATSVTQSAQDMLEEMAALLNTQYGGSYLFGGARTTRHPSILQAGPIPRRPRRRWRTPAIIRATRRSPQSGSPTARPSAMA